MFWARVAILGIALVVGGVGALSEPELVEGALEVPVQLIELTGPLAEPSAEISGLAWYQQHLVILPQYPHRIRDQLFVVSESSVRGAVSSGGSVSPRGIPFHADGIRDLAGYEGVEAIAFHGGEVFIAVEVETDHGGEGFLMRGRVLDGLSAIEIDVSSRHPLPSQTGIENLAYEALFVTEDRVYLFYEANGAANERPHVVAFDHALEIQSAVAMDQLEYRLTDVTEPDSQGRFWATNYYYPGTSWSTGECALSARFGLGETHRSSRAVERLVELQLTERGVALTPRAPIQLELCADGDGRNWEGIVALGNEGFIIATDEHPQSMLGFVRLFP